MKEGISIVIVREVIIFDCSNSKDHNNRRNRKIWSKEFNINVQRFFIQEGRVKFNLVGKNCTLLKLGK